MKPISILLLALTLVAVAPSPADAQLQPCELKFLPPRPLVQLPNAPYHLLIVLPNEGAATPRILVLDAVGHRVYAAVPGSDGSYRLTASLETTATHLELADVDGDGRNDGILVRPDGPQLVRVSNGEILLGGAPVGLPSPPNELVSTPADLDRDGRREILAIAGTGLYSFSLREGGFFEATRIFDVPWVSLTTVWLTLFSGDFNGDGREDVIASSENNPSHMPYSPILWGDGAGGLTKGADHWFVGTTGTAVADFDRDGRMDATRLDYTKYATSHVFYGSVAYGSSLGVFPDGVNRPSLTNAPTGFRAADFDGDGWLDLFATYYGTIWKGGPGRTFTMAPSLSVYGTQVADFDGDGRVDLVGTSGKTLIVHLNACGSTIPEVSLPVVVSADGANGARFETELILEGPPRAVEVEVKYVASAGGGSGSGRLSLERSARRFYASAYDFLAEAGLNVPSNGGRVGTIALHVPPGDPNGPTTLLARVVSRGPGGLSGVGLEGLPAGTGLAPAVVVPWLAEGAGDRSNLAVGNIGSEPEGDITIRVTLYPETPGASGPHALLPIRLAPGQSFQWNRVLVPSGFERGWARVERVEGRSPFFAYGVVNDEGTGDGSLVPGLETYRLSESAFVVPAIVESGRYQSEVVITNTGSSPASVAFRFVSEALSTADRTARFGLEVPAVSQLTIRDVVDWMRRHGVEGIGPRGGEFVGALFAEVAGEPTTSVYLSSRTSAPKAEGRYGVFLSGQPIPPARYSVSVPGVRQDSSVRTNVAILNTDTQTISFRVSVNGASGTVAQRTVQVEPGRRVQIDSILSTFETGLSMGRVYVGDMNSVRRSFVAYGVTNDGAVPGAGTDDGTIVMGR